MKLEELNLESLYRRAKGGFWDWVTRERDEIAAEIGEPIESIEPHSDFVIIKFSGTDPTTCLVETRLKLVCRTKEIGYYCLHEDENGNVQDDFLVFE
jgi:hypothetical protein